MKPIFFLLLALGLWMPMTVAGQTTDAHGKYTPHYYERVKLFDAECPIEKHDVVMLGNSLTEGGGDWGQRLEHPAVRNRGISGDVAMGVYDRLHQILPGRPRQLFLLIGINDVSHDLSTDSILSLIETVVKRIRLESPRTRVYLQSLLPIDESFGRYRRLNGKSAMIPSINRGLKALARRQKVKYIHLFPLFAEPGTGVLRKELTHDGLHLNEAGYRIWSDCLKRYVKR